MTAIAEQVQKQKDFFAKGKTKELSFRIASLRKLKNTIKTREAEILHALKMDLRKPDLEAYFGEIETIISEINYAVKNLKRWLKPKKVSGSLINFPSSNYIYHEPYGLVLIIAPWNYPFLTALMPLVGALAAGNSILLKPSEISKHSSIILKKIIDEAFDPAHVTAIEGDAKVSKEILKEKFDYIMFTGSSAVGTKIMQEAAKTLTPITLELGGKSPCIVDKNINLKHSARRIIWGKFFNAGQTCVAPDYLLVDKKIKKNLVKEMKLVIKEFFGEKAEESPDLARIINSKHFNRIKSLVDAQPEKNIICGAEYNKKELYISPTIIDNVSSEDPIMQEEIFGPILPIIEYSKINDAIKLINSKDKPLAFYIFSEDEDIQSKLLKSCSSGGVSINDTMIHSACHNLPFGGVGKSGMGKYHGRFSFETFSNTKAVSKRSMLFDIPVKYAPYTKKFDFLKKLLG